MNTIDMLNQIRTLLGVEDTEKVELAQMTLENGTVLEAEVFEANNEVFIITEEEKIALPVGEYTLEDGRTAFSTKRINKKDNGKRFKKLSNSY